MCATRIHMHRINGRNKYKYICRWIAHLRERYAHITGTRWQLHSAHGSDRLRDGYHIRKTRSKRTNIHRLPLSSLPSVSLPSLPPSLSLSLACDDLEPNVTSCSGSPGLEASATHHLLSCPLRVRYTNARFPQYFTLRLLLDAPRDIFSLHFCLFTLLLFHVIVT